MTPWILTVTVFLNTIQVAAFTETYQTFEQCNQRLQSIAINPELINQDVHSEVTARCGSTTPQCWRR